MAGIIEPAKAFEATELIKTSDHGIASRVLARTTGGNVTLFAFDAGEALSEHTAPFDALILVLDGALTLTIGGLAVAAAAGTITRLPAHIPHAVEAMAASRMLLIMLRDAAVTPAP